MYLLALFVLHLLFDLWFYSSCYYHLTRYKFESTAYLKTHDLGFTQENRHINCLTGRYLPAAIVLIMASGFFWNTVNSLPDVIEMASATSARDVGLPCCRSNSRRALLLSMIGPITSTTGRRRYLIIKKGLQKRCLS